MVATKTLYRSRDNRMLAGVLGGLAEYSNTDATIWRLLWVLLTVFTGFVFGIVAYLAAVVIIPEEPAKR